MIKQCLKGVMHIKNKYIIENDIVKIFMHNRKGERFETLIDLEDLHKADTYGTSWHPWWSKCTQSYYARCTVNLGMFNGKQKNKTIYLHKLILEGDFNNVIDRKSHDTLDNRKSNLKIATRHKNSINRLGANSNTISGERNVSWSNSANKWLVQLQVDGKNTCFW